jgi:hypothetical protein
VIINKILVVGAGLGWARLGYEGGRSEGDLLGVTYLTFSLFSLLLQRFAGTGLPVFFN